MSLKFDVGIKPGALGLLVRLRDKWSTSTAGVYTYIIVSLDNIEIMNHYNYSENKLVKISFTVTVWDIQSHRR